MATTYVIGAGASLRVGYPLASGMGRQLLDFMLHFPVEPYRSAARLLIETFGRSSDIEDMVTELGTRIQSLNRAGSLEGEVGPLGIGNLRGYLGVALREWFREIHRKPATAYAEFTKNVAQPGDVIITFNYDDSLERELKRAAKWDISRGYGFPLAYEAHPSGVLMLKLHGSMNWLVSVFGGATGGPSTWDVAEGSLGRHPVIHQADLEYLGYSDFRGHLYSRGGAFPCLILPGRKKQFFYDTSLGNEFTEFWRDLWSQATQALQRNEKLVLCGYSLLPVDQDSRDLLLTAPKKATNITIVSGDQNDRIASDFRAVGFQDVNVFPGGRFEQWVQVESLRHEEPRDTCWTSGYSNALWLGRPQLTQPEP